MNTQIKVVRYHLMDRSNYLLMPCSVTAFAFLVNLVIHAAVVPSSGSGSQSGGLIALCAWLFIPGIISVTRTLPFGFALGLSRRTYYKGTILLMLGLAAAYGLGVTVLQAVERVTGGWGVAMHFFQVPWILDGSWYVTWLTSFVVLALMLVYGMWFGLVFRRWNVTGLLAFIAAHVTVLLAVALLATWAQAWPEVGSFFVTLSVLGFAGVLAALTAVLALGGFGTMRRVTV